MLSTDAGSPHPERHEHERVRRDHRRRRCRRALGGVGAVPGPAPRARRRRRGPPQRPGRPHAGLPLARRDAARASCSPPDATRCRRTAAPSSTPPSRRVPRPAGRRPALRRRARRRHAACAAVACSSTTGLHDELPDIPGLRERWARDVLHCPDCHGHEVRDQRLGVVWNGPGTPGVRADRPAVERRRRAAAPRPAALTAERADRAATARAIGVVEGPVPEVLARRRPAHRGRARRRRHAAARRALRAAALRCRTRTLLIALGCALDADGWVVTGPHGSTQRPGRPGGRQRRQPARPGHHRRRGGLRGGHRPQRRAGRGGRPRRRPRPRPADRPHRIPADGTSPTRSTPKEHTMTDRPGPAPRAATPGSRRRRRASARRASTRSRS